MPQTSEHAAVLRALGVAKGVVAVTKSDLLDPEPATEDAGLWTRASRSSPARRAPATASSRYALRSRVAAGIAGRSSDGRPPILHVDRSFTVRGAGTVVTGTLWSGSVGAGDRLRLLPADERVRVRGVQVHDSAVERADAGQRVAINLVGVRVDDVGRGDVVAGESADLRPAWIVDATLDLGGAEPPARADPSRHAGDAARIVARDEGAGSCAVSGPDRLAGRPLRGPLDRPAGHAGRGAGARPPRAPHPPAPEPDEPPDAPESPPPAEPGRCRGPRSRSRSACAGGRPAAAGQGAR